LCANPVPEMWPWDAKEAGAAVVATGRSDFPNQVNNSVGFPGIFRGTLDVRAKTITDEMCIAAAVELAKVAEDKGLSAEYIMPTMDDWEVFPREAAAVAMKAVEQGIALRTDVTFEQEVAEATAIIGRARDQVQDAMAIGYIPMPEGSRAPAPTRAAIKAVARGGVDYAGELADRAVDAIAPAAQRAADAAQKAADKAAEAIKRATERKKD
jgi:Malic enzyme, NAD binding domain